MPDLDFAPPPPRSGNPHTVTVSGTTKAAAAAAPSDPPVSSGYGGGFDFDDEMEIDRNVVPTAGFATGGAAPKGAPLGGKLELGDNLVSDERLSTRSHVKVTPRTNWAGGILSTILVAALFGGAGFALARFVHRRAGWNVVPFIQKALDGSSALWSGAGSLLLLALAITFTIMAMYAKPRSAAYGLSAIAAVIIAITLMIITFSVGPDGVPDVPPDGGVLIPWLLAGIPLGVALRLVRNAWARCFEGGAKNALAGALVAAIAAGVAFSAVELVFGAGLGRFL